MESEVNIGCSCNRVKYNPIKVGDKYQERWSCDNCGCEFIKKAIYLKATERVKEVVKELKIEMKSKKETLNEGEYCEYLLCQRILKMLTEEE